MSHPDAQGGLGDLWRKVVHLGRTNAETEARTEAVKAADPRELEDATTDFVEKLQSYAALEAQGSLSDLECLAEMNHLAATKYKQVASSLDDVEAFKRDLAQKHEEAAPIFAEIEKLHDTGLRLERATALIEAYAARLDTKCSS